jgi:DNA-nicking Smr family endonuclease
MQNDSTDVDRPDDEDIDDDELFRQTMQGVTPLKAENRVKHKPAKARPRVRHHEELSVDENRFSDAAIPEAVAETLNFARSGVQQNTLKKMRQGKLPIDNNIDLHGMTVTEARSYLLQFLAECEHDSSRVVIIVHGKGYRSRGKIPVIKTMLNRWLRESPEVLAFHSAKPKHGGSGALYVLLKK